MINPSFKELGEISPSRYEVTVMVMKRAALLTDGSEPLVQSRGEKPVTVALDEIMARKVVRGEKAHGAENAEQAVTSEAEEAAEAADEEEAAENEEETPAEEAGVEETEEA